MVEHGRLLRRSTRAARERGRRRSCRRRCRSVERRTPTIAELRLPGGGALRASLAVACDGARSRLREEAGIGTVSWPYGQSGIVATIGA